MKKILSLILCSLLLLPMALDVRAEEDIISITTREDLENITQNPEGSYRLDADIDMAGKEWVPISFRGSFDGRNHAIYNLTVRTTGEEVSDSVDGNSKHYDTVYAGLFSVVRGAEIRDLQIMGADVSIETDQNCFAAILAGCMKDSLIENCTVEGSVSLYTTNIMVGVGGVAGFGRGDIRGCSSNVELVFADRSDHDSGIRCEQFMGGILATGCCNLTGNTVNIRGYDSCWGYVHNGGVVGMHYKYGKIPNGAITDNHVTGFITFFENNPDRRAYCGPIGGEMLPRPTSTAGNTQDFKRDELRNQTEEIVPHSCKNAEMEEIPVFHNETEWGYTLHRCPVCGYEKRTDYQAPGHLLGDWATVQAPSYQHNGLKQRLCTVCGQVQMEEILPMLVPVSQCTLSETQLNLHYKEQTVLQATVTPEDAENTGVTWKSSDESVITVDAQGHVTATGRGNAVITCISEDGFASSTCQVTVGYSPLQWVIVILLFGWLWY